MAVLAYDPVQLLLRALDTLEPDERNAVLAWLLERGGEPGFVSVPSSVGAAAGSRGDIGFRPGRAPRGDLQMVPMRLATDSHQRLRDWCGSHETSMATVVRGLVDRFLDEQRA